MTSQTVTNCECVQDFAQYTISGVDLRVPDAAKLPISSARIPHVFLPPKCEPALFSLQGQAYAYGIRLSEFSRSFEGHAWLKLRCTVYAMLSGTGVSLC